MRTITNVTDNKTRRRGLATVALAVMVIASTTLASCSGGSTSAGRKAKGAGSKGVEAAGSKRPDSRFCVLLNEIDQMSRSLDPSAMATSYGDLLAKVEKLSGAAPADLRTQVKDYISGIQKVASALEKSGWDFKSFDMSTVEGLDAEKFEAASTAIMQYRQKSCAQPDDTQSDESQPEGSPPEDSKPSD